VIALAYPGLFDYELLLSLKKRDFEVWAWKAQKALINRELRDMNTARIATANNEHFSLRFNTRQKELFRLEGKLETMQKEAWDDLKKIGRG